MSDNISKLKLGVKNELDFELKSLKYRIGLNIQNNKPISEASGKTRKEMRVEATEYSGVLWGRRDFSGLEDGNSPLFCSRESLEVFKKTIYTWSKHKKIEFKTDKQRISWSNYVAAKLQKQGTRLYRAGGRSDIYSNEFQRTFDNLSKTIGQLILQYKLL